MIRLIAIDFSQKSPHFSLWALWKEATSPSTLKVVEALDNYSLVFVIFINFWEIEMDKYFFQLAVRKGQVEKYVNVEARLVPGFGQEG